MDHLYEERKAAFVLIWTEGGRADEVAKAASTKSITDEERSEVTAIVRWAAASRGERSDAPDVIAGVSATDEEAIERLVEKLTGELSGLKNPQDPQAVYVNPRYVEGWTRPHNGWP
ncbi:MAG: hypothetical protein H8E90_01265 [Anaerolineales bacterium]|nr:hypothetical protein [Anaerolineales bacterium]